MTYGGGTKGRTVGKGNLNLPNFPPLKGVLLVKGLMTNLISISQLCDDNLMVLFSKNSCVVFDSGHRYIMTGTRSKDNCYMVDTQVKCNKVNIDDAVLWHKRVGHVIYKSLDKLVKIEAVRGLPKLVNPGKVVCEDCLKGKQTKAPHSPVYIDG